MSVSAGTAPPLFGRIGDGARRKPAFLGCAAAVALGCVISALATSLPVFLVGRWLQGMKVHPTTTVTRSPIPAWFRERRYRTESSGI